MARRLKKIKGTGKRQILITKIKPRSPISEQYRTLRTNIDFSPIKGELKTLMLTSTAPGEGKTTTAANLSVVFAQQGKRVLLVDADLRKPSLHFTFNVSNSRGLTSVLTGQVPLDAAILPGGVENLSILTSGPIPPNPAELLGSMSFARFFEEVKKQFDIIIYDTPPILAVTDGQIIANKCDGTLLVVSAGKTAKVEALRAKELLKKARGKLLGAILNRKKRRFASYLYYHYYHGR